MVNKLSTICVRTIDVAEIGLEISANGNFQVQFLVARTLFGYSNLLMLGLLVCGFGGAWLYLRVCL